MKEYRAELDQPDTRCRFCIDTIRPNTGPAKDEAPFVHRDGFIACHRKDTIATPRESVTV